MDEFTKGELLIEGKTKKIFAVEGDPKHVIVEYKNAITAFDDPSFTKEFTTKAKYSNTITSRAFELLNAAGVPTAYVRQLNDTDFLALSCHMIPLEVVARRYAFGSYLKRMPEFMVAEGQPPHRFDPPVVEFFLKTTKGGLMDYEGKVLVEGLDPLKGEEDPLIANPKERQWRLMHPKTPRTDPAASLERTIDASRVLGPATIEEIEAATIQTLRTLETYFASHDFKLIDFKIEFGLTMDSRVVVSDVIDNDSWRLRDENWNDVSKQSFRDGEAMSSIEDKYAQVAALMETTRS
ncbi:MAG: hypothetical protein KBD05_02125 [Candidatus Pacebacteria bacterium]|nr:hypothetical protein [Candidatus Paceibacterota bacterium]